MRWFFLHFSQNIIQMRVGIFFLKQYFAFHYRNLFKKVSLLMKTHQIPLDAFLAALKIMKVEDIDKDETECILVTI